MTAPQVEPRNRCEWSEDEDGYWLTGCDNAHLFNVSGPTENGHVFCPYCGGRLVVVEGPQACGEGVEP